MSFTIDGTNGLTFNDATTQASTATNASNLASGTVATARLGSGTANSTTYLRGDSTWASVSAGVTSVNGQTGAVDTTTAGNIGAIVWAQIRSANTGITYGTTYAGSTLYPSGYSGRSNLSSGNPIANYPSGGGWWSSNTSLSSGTWRSMSQTDAVDGNWAPVGIFVRVS
jgi:hypothetical protein